MHIHTLKQIFDAITKVKGASPKSSIQCRTTLTYDLLNGFISRRILKRPFCPPLWRFAECILHVNFKDFGYDFLCSDSFLYNMNPYTHEPKIVDLLSRTLSVGDVFIDVGAMVGLYTIIASKIVGNNGHVFSIEPNPENLVALKKNIRLNSLQNVAVVEKALGEKEGKIRMYYDKGATHSTSYLKGARRSEFLTDLTRLDSLTTGVSNVKFLKIDTEGYDLRVLEGGKETLHKTDHVVVETNNEESNEILSRHGFLCKTLPPSYLYGIKKNAETIR